MVLIGPLTKISQYYYGSSDIKKNLEPKQRVTGLQMFFICVFPYSSYFVKVLLFERGAGVGVGLAVKSSKVFPFLKKILSLFS